MFVLMADLFMVMRPAHHHSRWRRQMEIVTAEKTNGVAPKAKRSLSLDGPAKEKAKTVIAAKGHKRNMSLTSKKDTAIAAAKSVKTSSSHKIKVSTKNLKGIPHESGTRAYAPYWAPASNKSLAMKTDLSPHKKTYDRQLNMKHFGLALVGLTTATEAYLKHRLGTWGLGRLIEKKIVSPVKGKDGLFAINRKAADERYAKFLEA